MDEECQPPALLGRIQEALSLSMSTQGVALIPELDGKERNM
jgi:hypothetical protein